MYPERVMKLAAKREVFLHSIVPLSDGSYWLPNCGGDSNGGGIIVYPDGDYQYWCSYWAGDDDCVTVLSQLAEKGIYPVKQAI